MTTAKFDGRRRGHVNAIRNAFAAGRASAPDAVNPYRHPSCKLAWEHGRNAAFGELPPDTPARRRLAQAGFWLEVAKGEFSQRVLVASVREALGLARRMHADGWDWEIGAVGQPGKYSSRAPNVSGRK